MLPKSIQHIENKSKIIFNAGKMARRLSIDFSNRKFMYEAKNRKAGKMDSRYEALYKLKNKYRSEETKNEKNNFCCNGDISCFSACFMRQKRRSLS